MTLPELLMETERSSKQLPKSASPKSTELKGVTTPHKTPLTQVIPPVQKTDPSARSGSRSWTKEDWRNLDACFTDQRLILGARQGLARDQLAAVDDIALEDVVARFIEEFGPFDHMHEGWTQ